MKDSEPKKGLTCFQAKQSSKSYFLFNPTFKIKSKIKFTLLCIHRGTRLLVTHFFFLQLLKWKITGKMLVKDKACIFWGWRDLGTKDNASNRASFPALQRVNYYTTLLPISRAGIHYRLQYYKTFLIRTMCELTHFKMLPFNKHTVSLEVAFFVSELI